MVSIRTAVIIIAVLAVIALPVQAQGTTTNLLPADHWVFQALLVLSGAGLMDEVPPEVKELDRYELAMLVGEVITPLEGKLREKGLSPDRLDLVSVSEAVQELALERSGFVAKEVASGLVSDLESRTREALLALSDLRTEFHSELSVLKIHGALLDKVEREIRETNDVPAPILVRESGSLAISRVTTQGNSPALTSSEVVTGSTNSEEWEEETEFHQKYNLVFDTKVADGITAQAEISGDFSSLFQANPGYAPELPQYGSTPVELERLDLYIDRGAWSARISNRLRATLDRYTLYDQELVGAEAQVVVGNLGTTFIVGQDAAESLVTAVNGQYQLHPNIQVGGTVVSLETQDRLRQTNYGVNSYLRLLPGLEIGGQYYLSSEFEGGTALDITAWSYLAGINLQAEFTQVDENYYAALAPGSSDTYIPGSRSYKLSAGTRVGRVDLAAQYGIDEYETPGVTEVTKEVSREFSASLPVIPEKLRISASYRLVDVDDLYSPDYSTSIVNLGSELQLTDEITIKAGYELMQSSDSSSYRSVNADVGMNLNQKTRLYADILVGKEDGYQKSTLREAGLQLGYNFDEYTELIANYRLIDFDSSLDQEDYQSNMASAELRLQF